MKARNKRYEILFISAIVLLLAFASITNGSLWGDEIVRVVDPISGDLKATLKTAMGYGQFGYMLFMMLWTKLIGTTEFLLRCSNLPFVCLALFYVFKILKMRGWSNWWALVFFLHPMFVYYMDEATPYIIVYALALAFIYHVYFVNDFHSTRNIIAINIIFLIGVFVHFIFGFIIMFYFSQCVLTTWKDKKLMLRHAKILLCFCLIYLPLLLLDLNVLNGREGTGFGLKSILYIPYAFLGMQGVGLSRNDLRAGNFDKLQPVHIILLGCFVLVLLVIFLLTLRKWKDLPRNKSLIIGLLSYFAIILPVAAIAHMGLWERHCICAFPVYIILAIDIFHAILHSGKAGKTVLVAYGLLLCISAANIRLNYYYACDDYKGVTNRIASLFEQNKELVVIDNYETDYYSYLDMVPNPDRQVIHAQGQSDANIENLLTQSDTDNRLLVLFEKNSSKELYHHFDNDERFIVDDSYNSFKLISYAQPTY